MKISNFLKLALLTLVIAIFCCSNVIVAQPFASCGHTQDTLLGLDKGQGVTFNDSVGPRSSYAGTVRTSIDGNPTVVYCVDLYRSVGVPTGGYSDTCANVQSRVQYILNRNLPYKHSTGELPDVNQEHAAIQMAIWRWTQNINLSTITDPTIRNRAQEISDSADIHGVVTPPIVTLTIQSSMDPDGFYVKTVDEHGDPIAVNNVLVFISNSGTLDQDTVNTNGSGMSPEIKVLSTGSGNNVITARCRALFPQGRVIHAVTGNSQSMAIALPVFGMMEVQTDWGALPIELSSFTSQVTGNTVNLYWATASEHNNSGFKIERKQAGSTEWAVVGNVSGHGTTSSPQTYTYADRITSGIYNYRLKQTDYNGTYEYFNLQQEVVIGNPQTFHLSQNYPNPFNPNTAITFNLPVSGLVELKVFDISGKEVATLLKEDRTAGYYSVDFNASTLSSGTYFYRLTVGNFSAIKKMTLIK